MKRRVQIILVACAATLWAVQGCSTILGLQEPGDAGVDGGAMDGTSGDTASDVAVDAHDASALDAGSEASSGDGGGEAGMEAGAPAIPLGPTSQDFATVVD